MVFANTRVTAYVPTAVGLLSLASAMGIGRFAFTPLLPLMQQAYGLTLSQGAWLATANYLGYLIGALANFVIAPKTALPARWALLAVAATTLAMGLTSSYVAWSGLRFISGVASAFVLVGAGAWALGHIASAGRPWLAGVIFLGVGLGIGIAGLIALFASGSGHGPDVIWAWLGGVAAVVVAIAWPILAIPPPAVTGPLHEAQTIGRDSWILVGCYGALGLGYIVPATFLPAVARQVVDDPAIFGWTWPVFGLAAALSTVAVSTLFQASAPRKVAGWSLLVMAVGVVAPLIRTSLPTLVISALCVGGTFMVTTMAGAQEARRVSPGLPTKLMGALTAAFALGQLAGPILVAVFARGTDAFFVPGVLAVVALLTGATILLGSRVPPARKIS